MTKDNSTEKVRPPTKAQRLEARLVELRDAAQLDCWTSFVESLSLPPDAYLAILTGRPEFIAAITPRALTEQEATQLYNALGVLLRTNIALRDHAGEVAILVGQWSAEFAALRSLGYQIESFAAFKQLDADGGES